MPKSARALVAANEAAVSKMSRGRLSRIMAALLTCDFTCGKTRGARQYLDVGVLRMQPLAAARRSRRARLARSTDVAGGVSGYLRSFFLADGLDAGLRTGATSLRGAAGAGATAGLRPA